MKRLSVSHLALAATIVGWLVILSVDGAESSNLSENRYRPSQQSSRQASQDQRDIRDNYGKWQGDSNYSLPPPPAYPAYPTYSAPAYPPSYAYPPYTGYPYGTYLPPGTAFPDQMQSDAIYRRNQGPPQ